MATWLLLGRTASGMVRNPLEIPSKLGQILIQGLIGTLLYYQKEDNQFIQYRNLSGAIFYVSLTLFFMSVLGSVGALLFQREIFVREKLSNLYSTSSFYIGFQLAELPLQLVLVVAFTLLSFFTYNFTVSVGRFFTQLAISLLVFLAGSAFGTFWGVVIKKYEVVVSAIPIIIVPFLLVSGFFNSQLQPWFSWFQYLSIMRYGFNAIMENEFQGGERCFNFLTNSYYTCNYLKENYPDIKEPLWQNFGILAVFCVGLHLVSFLVLYFFGVPKTR
jgi:hypothetical protein